MKMHFNLREELKLQIQRHYSVICAYIPLNSSYMFRRY